MCLAGAAEGSCELTASTPSPLQYIYTELDAKVAEMVVNAQAGPAPFCMMATGLVKNVAGPTSAVPINKGPFKGTRCSWENY